MCGIAGIFRPGALETADLHKLDEALSKIKHRGPDNTGQYVRDNFALGHVRLSIIDLSDRANQPMTDPDSQIAITYNGECYNYKDLAADLGIQSSELVSESDTEVVLKAFCKLGTKSFEKLNGIFAFCIVDPKKQKAYLVRDRMGVKPVYYCSSNDYFSFCSELKGISQTANNEAQVNYELLPYWAYYGSEQGESTFHVSVKKLPPGHYLEVDLNTLEYSVNSFWAPESDLATKNERNARTKEKTFSLLEQAVKRQLVSDVPVGVFLSGGIDSSAITMLASRNTDRIKTYSVGFDFDNGNNELPMAAKVAEYFGTEHHELIITGYDLAQTLEDLVGFHDYPFSDAANIPLYLLTKNLSGELKVVLQGDGGDELFGGYQRYQTLRAMHIWKPLLPLINSFYGLLEAIGQSTQTADRYLRILNSKNDSEMMARLLTLEFEKTDPLQIFSQSATTKMQNVRPTEIYEVLSNRFGNLDLAQRMLVIDTQLILPDIFLEKVDRSTMANGIEVRVPFLDNDVVNFVLGLSSKEKLAKAKKKALLIDSLRGHLPSFVLDAPKKGFGVPYGDWLQGPLNEYFLEQLDQAGKSAMGLLNVSRIRELVHLNRTGNFDYSFLLWKALNLCIWINKRG